MKSVDWPYPSVLAGSLRTLLSDLAGGEFTPERIVALKQVEVAGPLPSVNGELYFPAPKDLIVWEGEQKKGGEKEREIMSLRPMQLSPGERICDLPDGLPPVTVTEDFKPARAPAFWSKDHMYLWLMNPSGKGFNAPPEKADVGSGYLDTPQKDARTHVKIDPEVGAAEESLLFMTVGLDIPTTPLSPSITLAVRVDAVDTFAQHINTLDALHPLGGERRLVHWRTVSSTAWDCPRTLREEINDTQRVRLILATPALFKDGWKPSWLNNDLEGCPPGTNVRLKLVSACVERWRPLSGWSLEAGQVGPKAIRRLVPAGSVYFFAVQSGDATTLVEKLWLRSVSDEDQDRRDGFGLALWGVWDPSNQTVGET